MSYGVYLWHWPAVVLLTPERVGVTGITLAALRIGFTALGAIVSWFVVEQPLTIARPRRVALAGGLSVGVATATLIALPVGPAFAYSNMRTDRVPPVVLSAAHGPAPRALPASTAPPTSRPVTTPLALPRAGTAMIVGDSGMFSASPAITAGLTAAGWRVVGTAYPGVGLTRLDGRMQQEWADTAEQYHVDLTIVMLGSWDVAWEQEHGAGAYRRVIADSLASFTRVHGKVLWLSVLPGGGKNDRVLDPFFAALPRQHPGEVEYRDIGPALRAPDGSTPRVVGERVLRQLDGWHLCQDGAVAIAHAALAPIGLDTTGWEAGPWRGRRALPTRERGLPGLTSRLEPVRIGASRSGSRASARSRTATSRPSTRPRRRWAERGAHRRPRARRPSRAHSRARVSRTAGTAGAGGNRWVRAPSPRRRTRRCGCARRARASRGAARSRRRPTGGPPSRAAPRGTPASSSRGGDDRPVRVVAVLRDQRRAHLPEAVGTQRAVREVVAGEREHEIRGPVGAQRALDRGQPVAERGAAVRAAVERLVPGGGDAVHVAPRGEHERVAEHVHPAAGAARRRVRGARPRVPRHEPRHGRQRRQRVAPLRDARDLLDDRRRRDR